MRPNTPPRLQSFTYVGLHRYFLTICTESRLPRFRDVGRVTAAEARLREASDHFGFVAFAYCFMPDHLHALLVATRDDASLRPFVRRFKQTSSFDFSRGGNGRLWQAGCYEHILRDDEATLAVARYILENPVRAGLTQSFRDYPFSGSQAFALEQFTDLWRT